jgi:HEAT repeat protein
MKPELTLAILLLCALPCSAQTPVSRKDLGRKALGIVVTQLKSTDSELRARAAGILGDTGNSAADEVLKKMLADKDKYVRIAAAQALWNLGSPAGVRTIYNIINDVPAQGPVPVTNTPLVELKIISQNKIRERALAALSEMKGKDASDVLFKLKNDNYGTVRDAASRELARLGNKDELAQFTDALTSEDEGIRYEATVSLSRICAPAAAGPLKTLLQQEKAVRVQMAALDALKCNPDRKDAEDVLLKLADDQNPTIRYKAVSALRGISDPAVTAKLGSLVKETDDLKLKITAQEGLLSSGAEPDAVLTRSALGAGDPDVRLEAVDVVSYMPDDDAIPLLDSALGDASVQVRLAAALQVLKRFSKK